MLKERMPKAEEQIGKLKNSIANVSRSATPKYRS